MRITSFPYPLGLAMLIPSGTVLYGFYQLLTNPYSVMKPPRGFIDFLKITYLFIIY